ncbi:hypothetical protein QR680_017885 [Steinernema hermaphroditum]|uniref:NR LBD domain-containing protein n=1 Tax=Steinernema hermaphroditum TaxID=289476 RepID=A0AA39HG64_9BILA|nr:hypothetical protein QR680_017885 [Steinernema hermaphroditum]
MPSADCRWDIAYGGVKFYKCLGIFQRITLKDQLALVKGTCLPLWLFYTAYEALRCGSQPVDFENILQTSMFLVNPTEEQAALAFMIVALNSAAPNLSPSSNCLIAKDRLQFVRALMRTVPMTKSSSCWVHKYHQLYNLVDQCFRVATTLKEILLLHYLEHGNRLPKFICELIL